MDVRFHCVCEFYCCCSSFISLFVLFYLTLCDTKIPYIEWIQCECAMCVCVCKTLLMCMSIRFLCMRNICRLLPRWCLVSCQSIFYNVAFHFNVEAKRKCATTHPLPCRKISFSKWFFMMKPFFSAYMHTHTHIYTLSICGCLVLKLAPMPKPCCARWRILFVKYSNLA